MGSFAMPLHITGASLRCLTVAVDTPLSEHCHLERRLQIGCPNAVMRIRQGNAETGIRTHNWQPNV